MSSIRRKKKVTDVAVKQFFLRHLPYEISMMRELHPELSSGNFSTLIHNAIVEAFLVHARNLIEFLKNKETCDFDPRLFTNPGYEPNGNFIKLTLQSKINQQVSHLTTERTAIPEEQLGVDQWTSILETVDVEIERFKTALKPEYKSMWTVSPQYVAVGQSALGATNAILITTSSTLDLIVDATNREFKTRTDLSDA